jgi:hypothetical protein
MPALPIEQSVSNFAWPPPRCFAGKTDYPGETITLIFYTNCNEQPFGHSGEVCPRKDGEPESRVKAQERRLAPGVRPGVTEKAKSSFSCAGCLRLRRHGMSFIFRRGFSLFYFGEKSKRKHD